MHWLKCYRIDFFSKSGIPMEKTPKKFLKVFLAIENS